MTAKFELLKDGEPVFSTDSRRLSSVTMPHPLNELLLTYLGDDYMVHDPQYPHDSPRRAFQLNFGAGEAKQYSLPNNGDVVEATIGTLSHPLFLDAVSDVYVLRAYYDP